jgi:hypothetical protein
MDSRVDPPHRPGSIGDENGRGVVRALQSPRERFFAATMISDASASAGTWRGRARSLAHVRILRGRRVVSRKEIGSSRIRLLRQRRRSPRDRGAPTPAARAWRRQERNRRAVGRARDGIVTACAPSAYSCCHSSSRAEAPRRPQSREPLRARLLRQLRQPLSRSPRKLPTSPPRRRTAARRRSTRTPPTPERRHLRKR